VLVVSDLVELVDVDFFDVGLVVVTVWNTVTVLVVTSVMVVMQEAKEGHTEVDVCLTEDQEDVLAWGTTDFVEFFTLFAVEVLEDEVAWWLVDLGDVEESEDDALVELVDLGDVVESENNVLVELVDFGDVVESENDVLVELFDVLLVEDLEVDVGAGHPFGGLVSYAVRMPFTAE
jgi:hypothetical protein